MIYCYLKKGLSYVRSYRKQENRMEAQTAHARGVLVTGGSRGIGEAIVRAFRKRGDRVAFFYCTNESAALCVSAETGAFAIRADVAHPAEVTEGIRRAKDVIGEISVLVNNAGISYIGLLTDMKTAEWDRLLAVNLSGMFYVTREILPDMIRSKKGSIINIGSMWGKTGASCEVAYSASKAGVRGFTMALAKEVGPSGISVNCIEPGVIETEMNHLLDANTKAALADETPLMRLGTPGEVADAVLFLSSKESSFITGQILGVDGGFAI